MKRTLTQIVKNVRPTKKSRTKTYPKYVWTRSHNPRLTKGLSNERSFHWISGTATKNYILKDPLIDWLKHSNKNFKLPRDNNGKHQRKTVNDEFMDFIIERGHDFEDKLVKYIDEHKISVVSVSDEITTKTCRETIRLMKEGVPVIHSAPFRNHKKHIRGVIDLLVRSDKLSEIIDENPLPDYLKNRKAPKLNGNYHYVVIDVKFSTLLLKADGRHLLNSGRYPAYKSQLYIYTQGIGEIQGYTSSLAFILGRRWSYTKKGVRNTGLKCLDKLGVIDYQGSDKEYITRTKEAIQWLKDVRKYGKKWKLYPQPSRPELYPNMCRDGGEFESQKKEIAKNLNEITQVWYIGHKQRQIALDKGITSWKDSRCTTQNLNIGGKRAQTIDQILNINRQDEDLILPKKIQSKIYNWNDLQDCNEIYVDFETFIDIFAPLDSIPEQPKTESIFMIGVYYKENGKWCYKDFTINSIGLDEEYRIMNEFSSFVKERKYPKLWYWHAEKSIWSRAEDRQANHLCSLGNDEKLNHMADNWDLNDYWCDMAKLFREEPIVIKNCFKYGLKEIAKAMYEHKMITTKLQSDTVSGNSAAVRAWKVYNSNVEPKNSNVLKDIIKYNEFDVKVLQDILEYLRKNHL